MSSRGLMFEGSSLDMPVIIIISIILLFDKESLQFAIKNRINNNEVIIFLLSSANRFAVNKGTETSQLPSHLQTHTVLQITILF